MGLFKTRPNWNSVRQLLLPVNNYLLSLRDVFTAVRDKIKQTVQLECDT